MAIYVHGLTAAIVIRYFDAISKEYTKIILEFLCNNDRNFILFRYVKGKSFTLLPHEIFVTVCHRSRYPLPPPPQLRTY